MNTCIFHVLGCRAYGCFAKLACWPVYVANKNHRTGRITEEDVIFLCQSQKNGNGKSLDEKDAAVLVFVGRLTEITTTDFKLTAPKFDFDKNDSSLADWLG